MRAIVGWLLVSVLFSWILLVTGEDCEVNFEYIHDGERTAVAVCPTAEGIDFGSHRFWCLGDPGDCTNGMTTKFWFRPHDLVPTGEEIVLMSNGGHLPYSKGFYLTRVWNDQYSAGISKTDREWKTHFRLISGVWIHLAITWDPVEGLEVYIDGFLEGSDSVGSSRYYSEAAYDVNSHIILGGWSLDGATNHGLTFDISSITIINNVLGETELQTEIGEDSQLYAGCDENLVLDDSNSIVLTATSTATRDCRSHCKANGYTVSRLQESDLRCNCTDYSATSTVNTQVSCTSLGQSKVYYVTHTAIDDIFTVDVSMEGTIGNADVIEGESVLFTITADPSTPDDISVGFGDGYRLDAVQGLATHWWDTRGSYNVVVTVTYGQVIKSVTTTVDVVGLVETVPPEFVGIYPSHRQVSMGIAFNMLVVDKETTNCRLNYGSNAWIPLTFQEHIQRLTLTHKYSGNPGQHDITFECSNSAGTKQAKAVAYTRNLEIESSLSKLGRSLLIPLHGPDAFLGSLEVTVNDKVVTHFPQINRIRIPGSTFQDPKSYFVKVATANDVLLVTRVLELQGTLSAPSFSANNLEVTPGSAQNYTALLPSGDHYHACVTFQGLGFSCWYIKKVLAELTVHLSATYPATGTFVNFVEIANDVSFQKTELSSIIDEKITSIEVRASSSLRLEDGITFFVDLNTGVKPPKFVQFNISYGDGTNEIIDYNNTNEEHFTNFQHTHIYSTWGMYVITVTASNTLSSETAWKLVQLGQNISYADFLWPTERVELGSYFSVNIFVNMGTDITYYITLGDSTTINLKKSVFFPSTAENKTISTKDGEKLLQPSQPVSELSGTETVIYHTADNVTWLELKSDSMLLVRHKYAAAGRYNLYVDVKNALSRSYHSLCAEIIVAERSTSPPQCQPPVVTFPNEALEVMRSVDVVITAETSLDCTDNSTVTYTWQAYQVFGGVIQRPVRHICSLEQTNNTIVIPERSLHYGLYHITVTVAVEGSPLIYSTASIMVRIIPSPPVSSLGTMPTKISYMYGDTVLDITQSKDPDLASYYNQYSGLKFYMFCCHLSQKETFEAKTQTELVSESLKVSEGVMFPNTSDNAIVLYDSCECFSEDIDTEFVDGTVTFPSDLFTVTTVEFLFRLITCKHDRCSSTYQEIYVRSSNDSSEYNKLGDLLNSGDTDGALQLISLLSSDLNSLEDDVSDNAEMAQEATNKRTFLIVALTTVSANLTNIAQVESTAYALESVTRAKSQVTENSRKKASYTMDNVARAVGESGRNQSLDKVSTVGQGIVGSLSNLLPEPEEDESVFVKELKRRRRKRSLDDVGAEKTEEEIKCDIIQTLIGTDNPAGCDEAYMELIGFFYPNRMDEFNRVMENDPDDIKDYILPELEDKKKLEAINKLNADREVARAGMAAVDDVASLFLEKIDDNGTVSLSSSKVKVNVQKLKTNTSGNVTVQSGSGAYSIPTSFLNGNVGSNASIGTKVVNSAVNQFTYGKGSRDITGGVVSLSLTDEVGNDLLVRDTDEPFEIWLPADPKSIPQLSYHTITLSKGNGDINYHAVTIPGNDSTLHIELRTTDPFDLFLVYVSYLDFPNETHYGHYDVIPRDPKSAVSDLVKRCEDEQHLLYTIFPPKELTKLNGTYRVGIKLKSAKIEVGSQTTNHTYGIRIFSSGCRFWNTSTEAWETSGCEVGQCTNYNATQCLCDHLTSFGGSFVVPPNTIDFNTVWSKFANLHENAAVFATVISILVLYILLLIWGRYMDKKDVQKWGAAPLEDNLPSDTYHYQLTVNTGVKKGAGTDSKVSFILSGDDNDSGVRRLYDGKRKHLARGSILNYILSVESGLGPLTFLRIWHDNSGKGKQKGWFLGQMEVMDLQTGERYFFLCDRWLAVEEDDGQVDRIIPVAGLEDLVAFKHLFSSNVRKKLSNEHLWFSVFSRPTRSKFTRCQRISCCLSLLFLTMITNAMWFKTEENAGPVTALKIGPFSFTLHQVFISFASTMIVFPVSFLLITIFRKSRKKKNAVVQTNERISKKSQKYRWKSVNKPPNTWGDLEKSKKDKFKDSMRNIISFHNRRYEKEAVEAAIEEEEMKKSGKKKKKKPLTFPHWVIYIGWFLVFVSVTCSAFFTILYSMEWGAEKANDWLVTFLMSFFQSVIVVQPVKVFLMVAFIACILKKPEINEEEGMEEDISPANDEELLSKTPENITAIMLQRKMAAQELQPPDFKALEAARELRHKEMKMEVIIKEIIIYAFFVLVLFFISYQTRDSQSYQYASHLRNTFMTSNNGVSFDKIRSTDDYWQWVENVMLPQMYAQEWLNGTGLKWWDKRCVVDLESRRVGIGRLRQLRVKNNSCDVAPAMQPLFSQCRSAYDWTDDDTKMYLPGWEKIPEENETKLEKAMKKTAWDYQNSLELKNAPYYGTIAAYKGGGYVANFARTRQRTEDILRELKDKQWLDITTRAVFLEFTVYNPNVNLFSSIIMLSEFSETGSATNRAEVKVFRLFSYVGAFGTVVLLFEIIYACFTLYFLIHFIKKFKKEKCGYFKCFWSILEFVLLAFSITCIVMYAFKHVLTSLAVSELHEAGSADFVNFQSLALYDEGFGYMVGCVVFLATLQFLKMLQFNRRMNMLGDTIRLATKDLKNFSVMFMVYFLAFCQLAYLLFGRSMITYENFATSVESMFAFCLGSFEFDKMQDSQKVLGPVFFFLFIGIVYIGLMGIFVTIIYDSFASVKQDVTLRTNEHEIVDFMWKRLKGLIKG